MIEITTDLEKSLLVLDDVSMRYAARDRDGDIEVLRAIDLTVNTGSLVCVAGRSGSGKTTLLNIAAALLRPSSGRVGWRNDDPFSLSGDQQARLRRDLLGVVFQDAGLITSLTAAENAALPGLRNGSTRDAAARVREVLESVGLSGRARHFPSQLSGGERQRLALARALFADPPLLIVDEPTANLDRRTADEVIDVIGGLVRDDRAVLVASHDRAIFSRADYVLELEYS